MGRADSKGKTGGDLIGHAGVTLKMGKKKFKQEANDLEPSAGQDANQEDADMLAPRSQAGVGLYRKSECRSQTRRGGRSSVYWGLRLETAAGTDSHLQTNCGFWEVGEGTSAPLCSSP